MTAPGIYRHVRTNSLYRVLFTISDSTNARPGNRIVVYISLTTGELKGRDEDEFNEWILHPDEPRSVQRFEMQS